MRLRPICRSSQVFEHVYPCGAAYERPLASRASTKAQWRIRNVAAFGWLHSAATCSGVAPQLSRELTETCSSVAAPPNMGRACESGNENRAEAETGPLKRDRVNRRLGGAGRSGASICESRALARYKSSSVKQRTEVCKQRGVAAAHGGVKRLGALDGGARLHASARTVCVSMEADWAGASIYMDADRAGASIDGRRLGW